MNRIIHDRLFRPIAILTIAILVGLSTSCKKEEDDNTGLLLLLYAWSKNRSSQSYLLTIPEGVAKSQ